MSARILVRGLNAQRIGNIHRCVFGEENASQSLSSSLAFGLDKNMLRLVYKISPPLVYTLGRVGIRIGLVYQLTSPLFNILSMVRIGLVYQLAPPPSYVLDKAKLV